MDATIFYHRINSRKHESKDLKGGGFYVLDQDISTEMESRNDADILGVRRGCTFIGYTNANFDSSAGNFVLTSGATDR